MAEKTKSVKVESKDIFHNGVTIKQITASSKASINVSKVNNAFYTFEHAEVAEIDVKRLENAGHTLDDARNALWERANHFVDTQLAEVLNTYNSK